MSIRINRTASTSVSFTTPQEIVISHVDDSIALGDGTNTLTLQSTNSVYTVPTATVPEKSIVEEASSTVTYVGKAAPGSATGSAVWKISKYTDNGSGTLTETQADGNANYDNIWNNRASLSYS
jgi:hypothetical protein